MSDSRQKAWPKVTVVIVNWNGERFLERCLTALLAQTAKPHEIIVVDNASSNGSVEIVRRFPSVRFACFAAVAHRTFHQFDGLRRWM